MLQLLSIKIDLNACRARREKRDPVPAPFYEQTFPIIQKIVKE